jgi:hypothetical protein
MMDETPKTDRGLTVFVILGLLALIVWTIVGFLTGEVQ